MTITETPQLPNGVNVEALLGAREAMTGMPAAAAFTFSAQSEWVNGTHTSTTVEKFFGIGEQQTHRRAFVLETDHPEIFASADHGMTPPEMLLAGLAGAVLGHWLAHRAGLDGAALDLAAAAGGIGMAALALRRNRRRRMEFSPDRAVKLLDIVNSQKI